MNDELYQQGDWLGARSRIETLFPQVSRSTPTNHLLCPDAILKAASESNSTIESVLLKNSWRSTPEGRGEKEFEDYKRIELFDQVFARTPPDPGLLWFLPDECFFERHQPMLVQGSALRAFINASP